MTIYVGNLNRRVKEDQLSELFSEYGEVKSVKIIKDMETGNPRGFAFVEMAEENSENQAIDALNETEFLERNLVVNKAKPKTSDGGGNRGGGNNRFGNNNSGGGGFKKRY